MLGFYYLHLYRKHLLHDETNFTSTSICSPRVFSYPTEHILQQKIKSYPKGLQTIRNQ